MDSSYLELVPSLELTIRPATAQDLTEIVVLDQICLGGLWTLDGYQRELDSPNSDLLILWSNQEKAIIGLGCSWAILEEAHITILAIHPEYRKRGLGQAMLYTLFLAAVHRGLERATLEVRVSNQAAISLYEQFGFKEAGRRRRYYQDTGEDALILWRGGLQNPNMVSNLAEWEHSIKERLSRGASPIGLKIDITATEISETNLDREAGC